MKNSKFFLTTLFAAAAMSADAYALGLSDAVLSIESFTQENITKLTDANWSVSNITGADNGTFTTSGAQGVIGVGSSGRLLSTDNRFSGIITVDVSVFNSYSSSGVLLAGGNNTSSAGVGVSGENQIGGVWNNAVWNNANNKYFSNVSDYAGTDGKVTIGFVCDFNSVATGGQSGTTLYIGDQTVYIPGLTTSTEFSINKILLSDLDGVTYSNLYWFNNAVSAGDMTSMLLGLTATDTWTWAGGTGNNRWETAASSQNWTHGGQQSVSYVNSATNSVVFGNGDNIAKEVIVGGEVSTGKLIVESGADYTFTGSGTIKVAALDVKGSITLGADMTLYGTKILSDEITARLEKIKGTGTLSLMLPGGNGRGIRASEFQGTLHVRPNTIAGVNGRLRLDEIDLGDSAKIELDADVDLRVNGAVENFSHAIKLNGATTLYYGSASQSVTELKGNISGENGILTVGILASDVTDSRELVLSGNVSLKKLLLNHQSRVVTLSGAETFITGSGNAEGINVKTGTLNIGNGTGTSVVSAARMELGDDSSSERTSVLNVKTGSTLKITGTTNNWSAAGNYKTNSAVLGEWLNATTATIAGTLLAASAEIGVGDTGGTINIENGGVLVAKGVGQGVAGKAGSGSFTLTLNNGGKLLLGSSGIANVKNNTSVTFAGGTVGALENWRAAAKVNVTGAVAVDTTKQTIGADNAISASSDGATITLGAIGFSGAGALSVSGAGTLALDGTITGVSISDSVAKITLNGGTLNLGSNLVYALTGDQGDSLAGGTLKIATLSNGGSITGTLSAGNFTWNGKALSGRTEVTLNSNAGTVTFGAESAYNLFWKGETSGTWDTATASNFGKDSASGADTAFVIRDNVTFDIAATDAASTYTVNVSSAVTPDEIVTNVGENVTLRFNLSDANLIVGAGTWTKTGAGVLEISRSLSESRSGDMIVEGGTLRLATSDNSDNTQKAFGTGTIKIKDGGTLDLNGKNSALVNTPVQIAGDGADGNGAVVNNAANEIGTGQQQFANVTLTANASVGGRSNFGTIAGQYASHNFNLGGFTLTKKGTNTFYVANTQFAAGTIRIEDGTFSVIKNGGNSNATTTDFVLAGGTLNIDASDAGAARTFTVKSLSGVSGSVSIGANSTLAISGGTEAALGVAVTGAGTLTLNSGSTLRFTNNVAQTFTHFNIYGTAVVESGVTLDLTNNARTEDNGGAGALNIIGGTVKMANLGWGATANFGANFNADRIRLSNGGVLEVTAAQPDGTGAGQRGFSVTSGAGTYRYTGTEASYIVNGENGHLVSISDGAELIFDIANSSGSLAVSKRIARTENASSTGSLKKTGAGALTLSGTVDLSGGFAVEAGSVTISSANFGAGTVTVASGATLTFTEATKFNLANLVAENGVYKVVTNNGGTLNGLNFIGTDDFLNAPGRGIASISASNDGISITTNARSLVWNGSGDTPTWNKDASNMMWTYNGGTASDFQDGDSVEFTATAAGTVTVGAALRAETVKFTGGEYTLAGTGSISSNGVLVTGTGTTLTLNTGGSTSIIHGELTIENGGKVTLAAGDATGWGGGANAINTLVINEGGVLHIQTAGGSGANQTFGNMAIVLKGGTISGVEGSSFDLYGGSTSVTTLASDTTATISNGLICIRQSEGVTFDVADGGAEVDLLVSSKISNWNSGSNYGANELRKEGAGTMKLTGANDYSGATKINGGTLIAASATALGTGAVAIADGAKLIVEDATGYAYANTISGSGTFEKTGAETLKLSGGLSGFTGALAVNEGKIHFENYDGTVAAALSGAGTLRKTGTGTLTLTGVSTETLGALENQGAGSKIVIASGARVNVTSFFGEGSGAGDDAVYTTEIAGVLNVSGNVTSNNVGATFMMANAGGVHNITVMDGGVLNLANASVSNRDGKGMLTVSAGGEANFGVGLHVFTNNAGWGYAKVVLDGGTINVGSSTDYAGVSTDGKGNSTVEINSGTIGSLADSWSSTLDIALAGDLAIDTTKKAISETGKATATDAGANVTLSGKLSGSGTLTVTGKGKLTLSGTDTTHGNELSGGVVVDGATLSVNSAGWGNKGNLGTKFSYDGTVLKNGGTLEVTAAQNDASQGDYGTGGALRGFSVAAGTGTYRYTATDASSIAHNEDAQFIGIADGATLNFDVVESGATLTVTKVIAKNEGNSASTASTGGLTKSGAGTLVLNPNGGANLFSGAVTLAGGTLEIAGASALGTSSNIVFSATGTTFGATTETTLEGLTLTFGDAFATDWNKGVALSNISFNGATITFSDATQFSGDVLLFTGYTGETGETNIRLDDSVEGRIYVDSGNVYFSTSIGALVWNGGSEGTWDMTSQVWRNDSQETVAFLSMAKVTFNTADAAVAVADVFSVSSMKISENVSFSAAEGASAPSIRVNYADLTIESGKNLTLGEGVTLDLSGGEAQAGVNRSDILGSGTVKLSLTAAYENTLSLGDDFAGTTHVAAGNFTVNDAKFGNVLRLADGVNFQLNRGSPVTFEKDLVLDGTSQVHQNGGADLTFNGSVTGAGTYDRRGGGTLTFNGAVELGGFTQTEGESAPTIFNGATKFADGATLWIGSANLASLAFNNSLTIGDGESLKIYYKKSPTASTTLAINELALSGASATLTAQNFHGAYQIKKLSLAAGTDSAALNLTSEHTATCFSVYELGAADVSDSGNFAGTINVSSTNNGKKRSVSLVISDAAIAKNAAINLAVLNSADGQLALGVNADSATVGGLDSSETVGDRAKIYSGKVAFGADGATSLGDGTTRSLIIDTTANADAEHVFRGVVGANLSLTKTGTGTQVLTNAGNVFEALAVSGGTLAATNVGALGATDSVTLTAGTLELRGVADGDGSALEFTKSLTGSGTFALAQSKIAVAADKLSGFTGTLAIADAASALELAAETPATLGASLDGAGTFEKKGDGVLTLSAAAQTDRTGTTLVSAGTLALTNALALGGSEVRLAGDTTLELRALGSADPASFSNKMTGTGTLALTENSQVRMDFGAQLSGFAGSFLLDTGTRLGLGIDGSVTFAKAFSGAGTLEKFGTGTLTLAAAPSEAFTGTLNVAEGTLKLAETWTLANAVTGAAGTTLAVSGTISANADKLSGFSGTTDVSGELALSTEDSVTLQTAVTGTGTLTKTGAGTLSLAAGTTVANIDLGEGALANVGLADGQRLNVISADTKLSGTNSLAAGTLDFSGIDEGEVALTIADGTTTVGTALKLDVNVSFPEQTNPSYETGSAVEHVAVYKLIEVADGASLGGWDALTKENFLVNGAEIESHREAVFTSGAAGQISLSLKSFDLTWNGGNGVWGDANAWTRADDGGKETYMNSDRVTFKGTATVTLGADVAPQTIAVKSGTVTLDCADYAVKYGSVSIGENATFALTIDENREYLAREVTVAGAGTLKLDMRGNATLSTLIAGTLNAVSGDGDALRFEKTGTGTLTVSGGAASGLAGFTAANTLAISKGDVVIDGLSSIGNAKLEIGSAGTAAIFVGENAAETLATRDRVTGNGMFEKTGAGTLTLSESNSLFDGAFWIAEGKAVLTNADGMGLATQATEVRVGRGAELELAFADSGALIYNKKFGGSGTIVANNASRLTLNGSGADFEGVFEVAGASVTARQATSFGNGTLSFADEDKSVEFRLASAGTFAGAFSGAGTVTVAASSETLTLSGEASDDFSGTLKVESSLVAMNAGVLGSADATVEVARNALLTVGKGSLDAKLSGEGMLIKQGAGTLTLANANNAADDGFTGSIRVAEGTLSVSDENALGEASKIDLGENTTLEIVVRENETFKLARSVSGYGDLSVRGDGVDGKFVWGLADKSFHGDMTFSGVAVTSANFLAADDGTVLLKDAAAWNARGGFSIGERNALVLQSTTASPTVRATNADSAAGIASTLTSGGFRADSGVSGSVTLTGLTVTPTTTETGAAGAQLQFSVDSRLDALNGAPITLRNDGSVTLDNVSVEVLLGGDIGTAFDVSEIRLVSADPNSTITGEADSVTVVLSDGSEVEYHYRGNGLLTLEAMPTGMNLAYAAMVTLPTETFSQDVRSLHRRMEQRRFGVEDRNEWQFFAQAQTMSADTGSDKKDSATFDYSTYGALVGADVRAGESALFGIALAYDRGTADIHDSQGKITSDAYRATLYAGTVFADYLYAEAGAHFGFASNEIDRKGTYDRNKGDADAWSMGAFATVGGVIPTSVEGLCFTPHVGLAYLTTHVDSFEERGTSVMDVDSISSDSLRASVGLGAHVAFDLGEVPTRLTVDVAYSRECLDDEVDAKVRTGDELLTRTEKAFAEDMISVGAGLDFSLSKNTGVFLNYTADFGLNSDVTHRANAGFRFTW